MNVGDKVKYTINKIDYLGIIVIKDRSKDVSNSILYHVSLFGKGVVITDDGSHLTKITE